jgi:cyclophilin family peptidyl-prolyl cis-trans isomerase
VESPRPPQRPSAFLRVSLASIGTGFVLAATPACSRGTPSGASAAAFDAGPGARSSDEVRAVDRAEDLRRASELPPDAQSHRDPVVRRAAARALARILGADDGPLLRALEDEDDETVAWAGYGLGESCRGREDAHVRALASRLASLDAAARDSPAIDPFATLVRAIGRCGGSLAEPTLRAWLTPGGRAAEAAAYGLGDLAARGASLSVESTSALLEASRATPPVAAALYAFGRGEDAPPDAIAARLATIARDGLGRPGAERIFAVRALGRVGDVHDAGDVRDELARVLSSSDFSVPERVEAARALGRLRKPGQTALAEAIATLSADGAVSVGAHSLAALVGDRFNVLMAALDAVGDDAVARSEAALRSLASLARLAPDRDANPAVVRRASALRCAAAQKLARGAWDSEVLHGCDLGSGEAGERARLASLERAPLVHARRVAWVELARSPHVRVREAALGVVARHPELGDTARAAIAEALAAEAPGVVAAAATLIQSHPDRIFVLAESERRAALDPASPPPSRAPAKELDRAVASALRAALARSWGEDQVETRVALLDAAVASGLDEARAFAKAACGDSNATVRLRAEKALAALGQGATCPAREQGPGGPEVATELGHALERPTHVVFETDAAKLIIRFDPVFAPIAVTRFVALARSGFYTGVTVHRVVPGFVAQFGDPGGDGYGGAGRLLRCETSPVPFEPLDVGVALAGRDTGSSQIFVTLARAPHLDGEYAWVGRAEGDWNAVAEGDVIVAVHVEE